MLSPSLSVGWICSAFQTLLLVQNHCKLAFEPRCQPNNVISPCSQVPSYQLLSNGVKQKRKLRDQIMAACLLVLCGASLVVIAIRLWIFAKLIKVSARPPVTNVHWTLFSVIWGKHNLSFSLEVIVTKLQWAGAGPVLPSIKGFMRHKCILTLPIAI